MPGKKQVWFYQGSAAAGLVRSLRGRYALRALPIRKRGGGRQEPAGWKKGAPVVCVADLEHDDRTALLQLASGQATIRLVALVGDPGGAGSSSNGVADLPVFAYLPRKAPRPLLERTIAAAFENMELVERERAAREELERAQREMEELNRIGVALSSQREVGVLLNFILQKSRGITGADAGSLYLVEEGKESGRCLRFKVTQNDSRQFPFAEFALPITENSMAGYVALRGEGSIFSSKPRSTSLR